jgi:hypothetical protein
MRTPARPPFVLRALAGLLLAAACGCSSTGSSEDAGPPRSIAVSLIGYGPAPFELVSESHTSRVELYSEERPNASTKVQLDEVMDALIDHLDELGFDGYARPGTAPQDGGKAFAKAIQVEEEGRQAWWPLQPTAGKTELKSFNTAVRDFLEIYNLTQGWQSVDNTLGGEYFDQQDQKKGKGGD